MVYFLVLTDAAAFAVVVEYWLPVLLGNTIGGVILLTLVNYAQTEQSRYPAIRELTVREVLLSWQGGVETPPSSQSSDSTNPDTD